MKIIITGGGGFLGQRLKQALLKSNLSFNELLIADISVPPNSPEDKRVKRFQVDLSDPGAVRSLFQGNTGIVFHLAAVVSSQAEKDFDLGWRVNVDATRNLLEACRHAHEGIRFVFASSLAVYGGTLPEIVDDHTALTPQSSYGTQKAIGELMVNDYSRKNFIDGRVLRLPTICIRPGKPNQAASSFVSSIIREPLNGENAVCPVAPDLALWLSSPETVIENFIHASKLDGKVLGQSRVVNLPGIGVTVQDMLDALKRSTDIQTSKRVSFKEDAAINRIISSWPSRIDNRRALNLGFKVDANFDNFISQYRLSQTLLQG
jgi:D-erythronate 2-dehydrogenase